MSQYKPGTWPGRVTDYGISETKAGDPQVFVAFDVAFTEGNAPMTWFGSLKEGKAQEITFKALQNLGLKGKVTDLLDGPEGKAIAIGVEARLVCEEEQRQDGNGTVVRIRWVNRPGAQTQVQRAEVSAAKAKLLKLGVDGALAKHRAIHPDPVVPAPADSDVPF